MKPNRILSLLISFVLIFGTLVFPARADFEESLYETVIHNVAAKCKQSDISEDGNFKWFLIDMITYQSLYPESESVLSAEEIKKYRDKLLESAKTEEEANELAKSIICFRALGIDAQNIYISDTEKIDIVEKLSALIDAKSNAVKNIYWLPYIAIAMREYATEEQNAYLLKAMLKQKAKWQDSALGTDAATPMILALSPYYDDNEEVKTVIDETIEIIKGAESETGLIGKASETAAPSTGLAIVGLSSVSANDADIEKLISGLMGEATPKLDGFLPLKNSFGTEQGFRGLLAYKLRDIGKSMYDFSNYPKNELKIGQKANEELEDENSEEEQVSEEIEEPNQNVVSSGTKTSSKTENVKVTVKIMTHSPSECNNSYTYKHNPEKYTASISKKIEIDKNLTVYDATLETLKESGTEYEDRNGYIASIGDFSEFDHGAYSGWQYMVDGEHQNVGCNQLKVKSNSVILWYYTDDYRYEYGSETYGYSGGKAEDKVINTKEIENNPKKTVAVSDTAEFVVNTVQNPQISSIGGEWAIIGLAASEAEVPEGYFDAYYENVENAVKEKNGILHSRKYTEYSRVALALTLIGKNPENVAGYNLIEPICDFDKTVSQGLNGAIWALIALDSGDYGSYEIKQKYVEYIVNRQLAEGGWAISNGGEADCDITAMALTALSNHKKEYGVSDAIERGVAFLLKVQNDNGGFSTYGEPASESISQVITAFSSLGIDVKSISKNGRNPVDALFDYYKEGEGFSHILGDETNLMATEQALYALASVKRLSEGKTPVFKACRFYDVAANKSETAILELSKRGIVSGMGNNTFAPDDSLTRAQFAALLVNSLKLEIAAEPIFSDVIESDWFYGYIACAYKNGLVFGVSETEFNPNENITLEEAAAILSRAAALCGIEADKNEAVLPPDVSDWARDGVVFCIDTGILEQEEISGKDILMRAQMAQMIYNLLEKAERI